MKLLFALLSSLFIFIFSIEIISRIFIDIDFKSARDSIVQKTQIRYKQDKNAKHVYKVKRHLTNINNQPKISHPYFGYVYNRALNSKVNRDGFFDDLDFSNLDKNIFYVGVFGGSFAKDFAIYQNYKMKTGRSHLLTRLKSSLPDLFGGWKDMKIINLSASSYRQPQQFIIAAFYADRINMAITIDGYNEIDRKMNKEFPVEYPDYSNIFYSLEFKSLKRFLRLYELIERRITITKKIQNNDLLSRSHFIGWLWLVYSQHVSARIVKIHRAYRSKKDKSFAYHSKEEYDLSLQEQADIFSNIWKKFSVLQYKIMKDYSVDHFHFIQPNQHIPNSKTLSPIEREKFFDKSNADRIRAGYSSLIAKTNHLQRYGYQVFPLLDIYKTTKETVYKDSCCHINWKGQEILETEIFKTLLKYYKDRKINH